jgi:8-oxo-dGTP pyrophosphatase MutT (NUDIX family)
LGHFDPKAPDLFRRTIANRRLANAVALSLNILDARGRALIVKRPKSITVAAEAYAVAVTGTLTEADLIGTTGNALARGAAREAKEELGLSVEPERVRLFDIVLTRQKYQPVALLELKIDGEIETAAESAKHGKDFSAEVGRLYALDLRNPKEFFSVTRVLPFSPASLYSLERAFARINDLNEEDLRRHKRQHRPSPALARQWETQPLLSVEP